MVTGEHIAWQTEGGSLEDDGISRLSPIRTLAPARYAVRSFDFKQAARPGASELASINQQGDVPALEVYEYAGAYGFRNAADGDRLSALRMEQIETQAKHFEALSNHRGIEAGRHFKLTGHFDIGSDAGAHYANRFRCVRKSIPWRPGRGFNSVEPRIYGLQTAIVVGPAGEEIHTDELCAPTLAPHRALRCPRCWRRSPITDAASSLAEATQDRPESSRICIWHTRWPKLRALLAMGVSKNLTDNALQVVFEVIRN